MRSIGALDNGALILIGAIQVEDLSEGVFGSIYNYGWIGIIAWIAIAIAAVLFQTRDVARMAATMPSQADYRY